VNGSDVVSKWALKQKRYRTVGKALHNIGVPRAKLKSACRAISKTAIASGEQPTIQREIDWLSEIAMGFSKNWKSPLELSGITLPEFPARELIDLSRAYEKFSLRLRAQMILTSSPLMEEQEECASNMASYLKLNGSFRASKSRDPNAHKFSVRTSSMCLELIHPRINFSPAYQINDVGVIHVPERVIVKDFSTEDLPEPNDSESLGPSLKPNERPPKEICLDPPEMETLLSHFVSSRDFDGVLPALHDYHLQFDPRSGHLRLLLELSEISFSAVRATHYVGRITGVGRDYERLLKESSNSKRLITLSLIPHTSDGFLMAAQRSKYVAVGRLKFAPGVIGNLELRDRLGLKVDRDQFDLPDLISTTVRKAKEKMAVNIEMSRVQILGLGKFSYEEEVETWVLLTTAGTEQTAEQFVNNTSLADQTEGAWKLTGDFYKIPYPRDAPSGEAIIRWAIHSKEIVPHLALALLAICLPIISKDFDEAMSEGETVDYWHKRFSEFSSHNSSELPDGVERITRK
jgi:hypothetical protein